MNKGTLWLQVWRHHKVMNYRLVQETPVYVTKGEREREKEIFYSYQFFGGKIQRWKEMHVKFYFIVPPFLNTHLQVPVINFIPVSKYFLHIKHRKNKCYAERECFR